MDRHYDPEERAVISDVEEFTKRTGKKFPTVSEIFHLFRKRFPIVANPLEIFDESAHGIIITDESGAIRFANRTAIVKAGLTHEAVCGRRLQDLATEQYNVLTAIRHAAMGRKAHLHLMTLNVGGKSSFWIADVSPSSQGVAIILEEVNLTNFC